MNWKLIPILLAIIIFGDTAVWSAPIPQRNKFQGAIQLENGEVCSNDATDGFIVKYCTADTDAVATFSGTNLLSVINGVNTDLVLDANGNLGIRTGNTVFWGASKAARTAGIVSLTTTSPDSIQFDLDGTVRVYFGDFMDGSDDGASPYAVRVNVAEAGTAYESSPNPAVTLRSLDLSGTTVVSAVTASGNGSEGCPGSDWCDANPTTFVATTSLGPAGGVQEWINIPLDNTWHTYTAIYDVSDAPIDNFYLYIVDVQPTRCGPTNSYACGNAYDNFEVTQGAYTYTNGFEGTWGGSACARYVTEVNTSDQACKIPTDVAITCPGGSGFCFYTGMVNNTLNFSMDVGVSGGGAYGIPTAVTTVIGPFTKAGGPLTISYDYRHWNQNSPSSYTVGRINANFTICTGATQSNRNSVTGSCYAMVTSGQADPCNVMSCATGVTGQGDTTHGWGIDQWEYVAQEGYTAGEAITGPTVRTQSLDSTTYAPTNTGEGSLTVPEYTGIYAFPTVAPSVESGTTVALTNAYGIYADLGYSATGIAGTFTPPANTYSIYAGEPGFGTAKYAIGALGNVGIYSGTSASELRLFEPSGSGTNHTGFKSPALAGNVIYTLPTADGTSGQLLSTNASAALSWTSLAPTATALAANGANCSSGQAPLGVDASGAAEGCWTPAANSFVTISTSSGTAPVADSATDTLTLTGTAPVTITGDATGDSATFSLADITDCSAGQFVTGIGANLALTCGAEAGDITDVFNCSSGDCGDIALAATDSLDFSAVNGDASGEGLILPQNTACTAEGVTLGSVCYDTAAEVFCISDGTDYDCISMNTSGGDLFYEDSAHSSIAGYQVLSADPDLDGTADTDSVAVTSGGGEQIIEEFATEDAIGSTVIQGGVWYFDAFAYVSNVAGVTKLRYKVYSRTVPGGTETLLFEKDSVEINATVVTEYETTTVQGDLFVNATDLFVVKVYAVTTNASAITVTFQHGSTDYYSHIHPPETIVHGGTAGAGDITDVWGCSTGNCNALTAAAGDTLDATAADTTAPCKDGTSAPATCAVGECFFDTDATAGQNLYGCTSTNTWTLLGDGGGGSIDGSGNGTYFVQWTDSNTLEDAPLYQSTNNLIPTPADTIILGADGNGFASIFTDTIEVGDANGDATANDAFVLKTPGNALASTTRLSIPGTGATVSVGWQNISGMTFATANLSDIDNLTVGGIIKGDGTTLELDPNAAGAAAYVFKDDTCSDGDVLTYTTVGTGITCEAPTGGGDSITVNTTAATNANFKDGDVDFSINTGTDPDDITATVACSGCIDITDIASDAVGEAELKAVDAATDEECLTYETTTGDFEWQACGGTCTTTTIKSAVVIASGTLGSDTNIDISSIATDYDYIEIFLNARSSNASTTDNLKVYLNNDTTAANYYFVQTYWGSGSHSGSGDTGDGSFNAVIIANNGTTDYYSTVHILIMDPGGSKYKQIQTRATTRAAATTAYISAHLTHWESTAAITRITLRPDTASTFKAGTKYQMIGHKDLTVVVSCP